MAVPFLNMAPMHASIKEEMQQAYQKVYDSNWFVLGENVEHFEQEYSQQMQVSHTVGVSNGLDSLVLALKVLGIGQGDEVIIPSNTYIATALAVTAVGATPVLAEPDERTYNISPQQVENVISKRTKALMPVHLYGQACQMDALTALAKKHQLAMVEDNAQAHLASFNGQYTGSFGHLNGVSFYPGKNLGALGDGGALTTNHTELANQAKTYRNYGSNQKYYNEVIGGNMRLDELQAAFLRVKLKKLAAWTHERQAIAQRYNEQLQGLGDLVLPYVHPLATHSYHLYVIRTHKRDALQAHLQKSGIGTLIHYPVPIHKQKAYQNRPLQYGSIPLAEEFANTALSLPLWVGITEDEIDQVVNTIKDFFTA
jgi:dTDP-4-amino-4,6-dideoxygalactose transaminase